MCENALPYRITILLNSDFHGSYDLLARTTDIYPVPPRKIEFHSTFNKAETSKNPEKIT